MNEIDFNAERGYFRVLLLPSIIVLIITIAIATSLALAPKTAFAVDLNRTVYCSRTGTKYHYVIDCSGMKTPYQCLLAKHGAKVERLARIVCTILLKILMSRQPRLIIFQM